MKKVLALLIFVGLCLAVFVSSPIGSKAKNDKLRKNANKIENSYIVVLDNDMIGEMGTFSIAPYIASVLSLSQKGKLKHVYQNALNGFAVEMSPEDAEALSQDSRVAYVEEDGV
ncbi:MAG TPA: protease inhibitor I9 family protein, partial [Pyrinomonadaceae bacterium]|nr:protease inhibitor I9 family protein [Pyrinomonadaceae bacterium]